MKKLFLIFCLIVLTSTPAFCDENNTDKVNETKEAAKETTPVTTPTTVENKSSENIEILAKKGFFEKKIQKGTKNISPEEQIKKTFNAHYKYSNEHDINALSNLYSDDYMNEDGFDKKIYFDLIEKTWKAYPNIKYKLSIKNIVVNDKTAIVQVNECAWAPTPYKSSIVNEYGLMESFSDTIYYMERIADEWFVVSDKVVYEKTYLRYGSAKNINTNLIAPSQVPAGKSYTVSLQTNPDKDSFVIASIGQENITYPQKAAEEVFRKLPKEGILERMFTANTKNLNEYASASFGVTKAEVSEEKDINIYVTGLGFITQRVNIIPKNNYIKAIANDNEKAK